MTPIPVDLLPINGPAMIRLSEMLASFPTEEAAEAAAEARLFDRAAPPAMLVKEMHAIWERVSRALDLWPADLESRRHEFMAIEGALAAATLELRGLLTRETRKVPALGLDHERVKRRARFNERAWTALRIWPWVLIFGGVVMIGGGLVAIISGPSGADIFRQSILFCGAALITAVGLWLRRTMAKMQAPNWSLQAALAVSAAGMIVMVML